MRAYMAGCTACLLLLSVAAGASEGEMYGWAGLSAVAGDANGVRAMLVACRAHTCWGVDLGVGRSLEDHPSLIASADWCLLPRSRSKGARVWPYFGIGYRLRCHEGEESQLALRIPVGVLVRVGARRLLTLELFALAPEGLDDDLQVGGLVGVTLWP